MKKKGLIVATIVMVVVLAASLTTATYAWFTAQTSTEINNISFSVDAGSDVIIGLKTDGVYNEHATVNDFVNSGLKNTPTTVSASGLNWSDGQVGLGYYIDTALDLRSMKKAVGTGTISETPANSTADATWVDTNTVIKASGFAAGSAATATTIEAAVPNYNPVGGTGTGGTGDYLDVVIGVKAAKANFQKIECVITVNPTDETLTLGMNAAIHVQYKVNGVAGVADDHDIFDGATSGTTKASYATSSNHTASNAYRGLTGVSVNAGYGEYVGTVAQSANAQTGLDTDTLYQIHLRIYVAGYDADCQNSALGAGSNIMINFFGTEISE